MKIRALRVSSVGPFRGGVALENLSGGLDVFIGPNEAGKSTLFRAFNVLFREPHTANNKVTRALQPAGGGSPRVEVDLEIDGRLWRYSKRWFGQRAASLVELHSGRALQGADAEAEASNLLARDIDRGALGSVLWVDQAKGFVLPAAGEAGDVLADVVRDEIADAVSGGHARQVAEMVRQRLDALLTNKRRGPRTGSAYHRAIEAVSKLEAEKAEAERQAEAAVQRLERLGQLRLDEERLAAPAEVERRRIRLDRARSDLQAAEDAVRRLQAVRLERDVAVAHSSAADDAVRAFSEKISSHAQLADQLRLAVARQATLNTESVAAGNALSRGEEEYRVAMRGVQEARERLTIAQERNRQIRARGEAAEVGDRLARARAAVEEINDVSRVQGPDPVTLKLLRATIAERDKLGAQVAAQTARLTFELLPEGVGRVEIGGRAVSAREELDALEPLTVTIAGIGRLTITPGRGQSLDDARRRLQALDGEIHALLDRLSVRSLAEAEEKADLRRAADQRRAVLEAQLAALAPGGLDPLADAHARLMAEARDVPDDLDLVDVAPLLASVGEAETRLSEAEHRREGLRRAAETVTRQLAILDDQIRRDSEALARLSASLPPEPTWQSQAAELARTAAERKDARDAAILAEEAWRRQTPDDEALVRIRNEHAAAEAETSEAARAIESLRHELAGLDGAIRRDGEMGSAAAVADLDATLAAARAHVRRFETEAEALLLLEQALADAARDDEDALGRPVRERLEKYADRLIPGLQVVLGQGFTVQSVHRFDRQQPAELLSMGTVEQIGLMTRLAYARLLADRGQPVPVILDDPLAHTDDRRLGQVFDVLEEAARHHQVVVLSCHEAAFGPLGARAAARRVELEPWTPAS